MDTDEIITTITKCMHEQQEKLKELMILDVSKGVYGDHFEPNRLSMLINEVLEDISTFKAERNIPK